MTSNILQDKILGCLYGQAIGDALGFGAEVMSKEDVRKYYPSGLSRYDNFHQDRRRQGWPVGLWTDDTFMMLSILESIVEGRDETIDLRRLAKHFLEFYEEYGHTCGILTRKALNFAPPVYVEKPIDIAKMVWELKGKDNAPNGGLMRTSIVGLWPYNVRKNAENVCKMTHFDPRCVCSCVVASLIIYGLVWENKPMGIEDICQVANEYDSEGVKWIMSAYNNKEIENLQLDDDPTMAYTYRTLSAALWAYFHAPDFKTGLLAIVNEGGDADTNAAIACAILGAKFGFSAIPKYYIENLHNQGEYDNKVKKFINTTIEDD